MGGARAAVQQQHLDLRVRHRPCASRPRRFRTASGSGSCRTPSRGHCSLPSSTVGPAAEERRDHPTGQLHAGVRRVAAQARRLGGVDHPAHGRVVEHHVGRLADLERPAVVGDPADPGGRVGHPVGDPGPVEQPGVDHRLLDDRERGLEPEHPERRRGPLAVLVLVRVGCVVGGDHVDGAVGQPLAERLDVGAGAQRRVDLVDRVVGRGEVVGEQQVVGAGLGGDVPALALGVADDVDRARPSTRGRRAAGSRRARRAGSRGR